MERLDEIIARVLPGLRAMIVEEKAGAVEAAPEFAGRREGGDGYGYGARGKGDAHPRCSSRSQPKRAATARAKRETAAP